MSGEVGRLIEHLTIMRNRATYYLMITLLVAAGARLSALVVLESGQVSRLAEIAYGGDAVGYRQLAGNLVEGQGFRFEDGPPTAFRMPGYPLFLAAGNQIGGHHLTQLTQIAADLIAVILVYATAFTITGKRFVAILAGAVIALNPLLILASVSLLPDTLVVCLVSLIAWLFICRGNRRMTPALAALSMMIAVFLKPTLFLMAIALSVLFLVYLYRQTKSSRALLSAAATMGLITILLLLSWVYRNFTVTGHFVPLTTSNGSNLYGGNNARANGGYVSDMPYVLAGVSEVESDRYLSAEAMGWIRHNPIGFLSLLPAKAARFFWPLSLGTSSNISLPLVLFIGVLLAMLVFYSSVVLGMVALLRQRQQWPLVVLLAIVLTLLLPSLLAFGAARFSLPAYPAFAVLAAVGVDRVLSGRFSATRFVTR